MIQCILDGNRRFVEREFVPRRAFYAALCRGQRPSVLWVGCSDSRVPVNLITNSGPGEIFVHRNVANLVPRHEPAVGAVLEYGIRELGVQTLVICGHYGCGGIEALDRPDEPGGFVSRWLGHLDGLRGRAGRRAAADPWEGPSHRHRWMVEENVRLQVENALSYPFVREAVEAGRLEVHGLVYDLATGRLVPVSPAPP
ncbi:carbonic anhydrase [Deferrisoma palaeochoriense]